MEKNINGELPATIRKNLLDILSLWSSKEKQLEYQKNVPIAQVSAELFCRWCDDDYHPETAEFKIAFNALERNILADFDKIINEVATKTPSNLPYIDEFILTEEWLQVNFAAIEATKKINDH